MSEDASVGAKLTLTEVCKALEARGVVISLSALSGLCKTGDVAALLHIGGNGSRKELPADAVDVLAAFWPAFKAAGCKLPQAAGMMRGFLRKEGAATALTLAAPQDVELSKTLKPDADSSLDRHTDALKLHAAALTAAQGDRLLTLKEAHTEYGVSMTALHKISIVEGSRRKVKASAVQAYIASL